MFTRAGVPCIKPDYIASFITDDPAPPANRFHIPEVAQFLPTVAPEGDLRKRKQLDSGLSNGMSPAKKTRGARADRS